jgi:ATP-dependent DNA helicase RecG
VAEVKGINPLFVEFYDWCFALMAYSLDDDIQYLKHVGPARAEDFSHLGVNNVRDLIFTFPRNMSDRSDLHTVATFPEGQEASILASAVGVEEKKVRRGGGWYGSNRARAKNSMTITTFEMVDTEGQMIEVVWFNQPWLKDKLLNQSVVMHGKGVRERDRLRMDHPQYELVPPDSPVESLSFGRIVPIYPCTGNLNQNIWRKAMAFAIESRLDLLEETLPSEILGEKGFPGLKDAVRAMHFPKSDDEWKKARERLVWEECFYMQLTLLASRRHALHDFPGRSFSVGAELDSRIRRLFPFHPTRAQNRSIREITRDMQSPLPMQRLLQGDVGSGKTAVAAYAMLAAVANRAQVCVMAPTSLLARQHYETFEKFLANSQNARVRMGLLVGGMTPTEKNIVLERLANGTLDIVAATHSAISESVVFYDLGLVIIDEQHKFGVKQRDSLVRKGVRPDMLVMTATPIPRSLALSVYGDLDVSVIDEMPPGRKPVKTVLMGNNEESRVWEKVKSELNNGRQAFVVCPLVEENEELDLKSAEESWAELQQGDLKGYRLELLHGGMKRSLQAEIMARFKSGETHVLVSTIVIEVGVDIPNATVMVVMHAERFGLAQLHQLRGRVGRGASQGWFIMMSDSRLGEAGQRLAALVGTSNGFEIAEADLRIRGPGEFTGTRQHGVSGFKLVDLLRDVDTIANAREKAMTILDADPDLTAREHIHLRRELVKLYGKQWDRIGGS